MDYHGALIGLFKRRTTTFSIHISPQKQKRGEHFHAFLFFNILIKLIILVEIYSPADNITSRIQRWISDKICKFKEFTFCP